MERELTDAIVETENLFPQTFANMVERDWGVLFVTPSAPDSHDGNHACVMHHYDDAARVVDEIASVALLERLGDVCRVDEVHTAERHRCNGCCRAVIHAMVAHYKEMRISSPLYLWVENPVAERIYVEAGFVKQDQSLFNWSAWREA